MHTAEATMSIPTVRPRDVTLARSGPPSVRLRDTLVLLFTIGAVVVACGLATMLVLHPFAGSAVAERVTAIIGSW